MKNDHVPNRTLVVDLDGTLIKTDIFKERLIKAFFKNPFIFLLMLCYNRLKISKIKHKLNKDFSINPSELLYNKEVLELIRKYKENNQNIVLASACDDLSVSAISNYLNIFSDYIGSTEELNLKGKNKLLAIKKLLNNKEFDYIGNSAADVPILKTAKIKYIISQNIFFKLRLNRLFPFIVYIESNKKTLLKSIIDQARIRQWSKNLLIFCPALYPVLVSNIYLLTEIFLFFILFSLVASATYVFNDIADIDSDRLHHKKCFRPIASGDIDTFDAFLTSILVISFVIFCSGYIIGTEAVLLIVTYITISVFYTFFAKKIPVLDLFFLASFYVHRLLAGCIIINTNISVWIILFTFLTFFSIGSLKRVIEIDNKSLNKSKKQTIYMEHHRSFLMQCSTSASFGACMIFTLYSLTKFTSQTSISEFFLSFISISIIFFLLKIRFDVDNGDVDSDPIEYLIGQKWAIVFSISILTMMIIFGVYLNG